MKRTLLEPMVEPSDLHFLRAALEMGKENRNDTLIKSELDKCLGLNPDHEAAKIQVEVLPIIAEACKQIKSITPILEEAAETMNEILPVIEQAVKTAEENVEEVGRKVKEIHRNAKELRKAIIPTTCAQCGVSEREKKLLQCKICEKVRYCGKECQRIHWYSVHKTECTAK